MTDPATHLRRKILNISYDAGACHIGSALSCVEILIAIYESMEERDEFLFSKASGGAALYALMAQRGELENEKLAHYLKNYPLPHKDVPGIVHSVGSIAHGLNVACGMALADRSRRVFVLLSDGEMQEGSTWEALWFAARHHLDNLIIIVDWNSLQACGDVEDIMFGKDGQAIVFDVLESMDGLEVDGVNGHNVEEIRRLIESHNIDCPVEPLFLFAWTIKGKGVPFMEDDYEWHYRNLTYGLLQKALSELE